MRLTDIEKGHIYIDGVDVATVGLDALRSSIAIIPQDPVLFSGTIRYFEEYHTISPSIHTSKYHVHMYFSVARLNLDPFYEHDDETLWKALKKSNLDSFVHNLPNQLLYEISESGENFSSGQRQLLCLAR